MKTRITLLGAGGKMGCRITDNLRHCPQFELRYVEVSPEGQARLAQRGLQVSEAEDALRDCQVLVLAVPDRLIGRITREVVPQLPSGALVIGLDPAAAYAEVLPERADVSYFVTHPCHPPLFGDTKPAGPDTDWFGGVGDGPQSIVCALHGGGESHYALGEAVAKEMFKPVLRVHRITVEQMAILEPAVVESIGICCVLVMRQALDRAVAMGVPKEAAWDFVLGHIRTELAIVFGFAGFPFSDGAKLAMEQNMKRIFRPDWMEVMDPAQVKASVREITAALEGGSGTPPKP